MTSAYLEKEPRPYWLAQLEISGAKALRTCDEAIGHLKTNDEKARKIAAHFGIPLENGR